MDMHTVGSASAGNARAEVSGLATDLQVEGCAACPRKLKITDAGSHRSGGGGIRSLCSWRAGMKER